MPIFVLLFAVLLSLTACGDDSKSSTKPAEEDQELSSGGHANSSSSYKITSATSVVDKDAIDINDDNPSRGTVEDTLTGKTYKTLTLGIYTWIDENIVDKDMSVKSTCYAYDDKNCPVYGRLYMQKNASDMCPSGFKLPTVSDWEYRFERASDNPLVYGGVCYKRDTLECEGLKDSAMYLAYGDSAVLLTHSGNITGLRSADNGFYSLRCVKYRSIVYKMYELPDCDENRSYNYPSVYVVDKDSSYSCYRGKWTDASRSHSCMAGEEGQKYLVNGVVYICKNGTWSMATIFDTDTECGKDNLYEEYVMNGVRYACVKEGMVRLGFPESEFGLCRPVNDGKIARTEDGDVYVCDSVSWRIADIDDLYGECDEKNYSKVVQFMSSDYVCRKNGGWDSMTPLEKQVGVCKESIEGKVVLDTITLYKFKCVDGSWQEVKLSEALGECSSQNLGDSISYVGKTYLCKTTGWKEVSDMERRIGRYCTDKNLGEMTEYSDPTLITPNGITTYICKNESSYGYRWTNASTIELEVGYCPQDTSFFAEGKTSYYKCDKGAWKSVTQSEVLGKCTSATGIKQTYLGKEYICDTTASISWFRLTSLDSALGGYCRTAILNTSVINDNIVYVCRKESKYEKSWVVGTMLDYMGRCDKYTYLRTFNGLDSSQCTCYSSSKCYWRAILLDSLIDTRENNTYGRYGVVSLGTQKWMNRDLHYTSDYAADWQGRQVVKFSGDLGDDFYYKGKDVLEHLSTICPSGTHVPSKAEWQTLFDYAESLNPGLGVRVLLEWNPDADSLDRGYDLYGMNLKRAGYLNFVSAQDTEFGYGDQMDRIQSYYWVSDGETSDSTANFLLIDSSFKVHYNKYGLKKDAYRVRCILD